MPPPNFPIGSLDSRDFLRRYWQKRPLLVRQAWPGFDSPITPDELAGLACETEVDSRLITEYAHPGKWDLQDGPFDEDVFASLPSDHWTLLVQEVNKYVPAAALLLDAFDFIPGWRVDDLMISYAEDQGSVGPHFDQYDVFLFQAQGRRRWRINTAPVDPDNIMPYSELRVMREFKVEQEWLLEPGDLLYLPPGVAHHGIAEGPCMTYSFGFRAPALQGLVTAYAEQAAEALDCELLYSDPDLQPQAHSGAIAPAALQRIREVIRATLSTDDRGLDTWFACQMSLPQRNEPSAAREAPLTAQQVIARLIAGETLWRSEHSRFTFLDHGNDGITLCVDGKAQHLDADLQTAVATITGQRRLNHAALSTDLNHPTCRKLLTDLVNRNTLYFEGDE